MSEINNIIDKYVKNEKIRLQSFLKEVHEALDLIKKQVEEGE